MKATISVVLLAMCLGALGRFECSASQAAEMIELWPAGAPATNGNIAAEYDTTKPTDSLVAGKRVIRLGNVAKPTLTLYRPPRAKDTGAAVLVCPGGGYHILAMDLEGTEVCAFLNSIGVTAALLKYRVPKRKGQERSLA
jgi:acetyl esterase/lipase